LSFHYGGALVDHAYQLNQVTKVRTMEIDTEKVDEAVLAPPYLTLHDGARPRKSFD
jgi:hypothetical protein